jgi:four helix bundle protein
MRHGGQFENLLKPKTEFRMPKEVRNLKSEKPSDADIMLGRDSVFWQWGDAWDLNCMLWEDGRSKPTPPDLMGRTAQFGEAVVRFVKKIPRGSQHPENNQLVDQLVGVATSIGANYCEADDAVSGRDYPNRIGTCRKESKETMFFPRMVAASEEALADEARTLWREAKEPNLIFGSIWRKRK